mmetsp:Transcript_20346/g.81346  ORF Transcript_20346/g.81346 Transcript_20346/m.81346 type:complete len:81 (-) Transcript_20346:1683-1925(-)
MTCRHGSSSDSPPEVRSLLHMWHVFGIVIVRRGGLATGDVAGTSGASASSASITLTRVPIFKSGGAVELLSIGLPRSSMI